MNSFITATHIDAHTILHSQWQNPLFLFQKVPLCFSEWAGSVSPSCRKCKRTSWKAESMWSPVRVEVSSCHFVTVAICFHVHWCRRHCYSGGTGSGSLTGKELPVPREAQTGTLEDFSLLALLWLIYNVTLKAVRTCSGKDYDNL